MERYEYNDFGSPTLLDGNGQPVKGSGTGNPYLFRGLPLDPETGFHFDAFTGTYYEPVTGRTNHRRLSGGQDDRLGNA